MSYLDRILEHKRAEVARQQRKIPLDLLKLRIARLPPPRALAPALAQPGRVAVIAEVKQASPSRGVLVADFDPPAIARAYVAGGAAAISILTDEQFFLGSLNFITRIRAALGDRQVPLLRKDFILDRYQVYESRAAGADALLLIVAALDDTRLADLLALTHTLGMQALVEVHDEDELARALRVGAALIGVNNRDLQTFQVDLGTTERLAGLLPDAPRPVLVSESGIFTPDDVRRMAAVGVDAVLVGEGLVTAPDMVAATRALASVVAGT